MSEKREIAAVIKPIRPDLVNQTVRIYFYHFYDMIRFINVAQLGDMMDIKFKIGNDFNCSNPNILLKYHKPLLSPLKNDLFSLIIILKNNCKNLFHDSSIFHDSIKNEIKKEFIFNVELKDKYSHYVNFDTINLIKNLGIDIVYIQ